MRHSPRANTTKANPGHILYSYVLRDVVVDHPNQAWATDIAYIPYAKGFMYLVAIIDWSSRKVLSWRPQKTLSWRTPPKALEPLLESDGIASVATTG